MEKGKTFLQRRILPWVLAVALCVGVIPLSVWASTTPTLLQEQEATKAMEVLYEEDFESGSGMNQFSVPEGASAAIQSEKLSYTAADGKPLYILGGEMWGYYTAEADVSLETENAQLTLAFYVQNADKMQTVSVPEAEKGSTYRVKVVVNGTTVSASYKTVGLLTEGEETPIEDVPSIAKSAQTGTIGFVTDAGATLTIDNIKVTRNMDKAVKHTLFDADFTNKNTSFYNIKTSESGINVSSDGDKLYITNSDAASGVMYFDLPDAAHWKNYVVEVDMFQTAEGGGLLYRVQNTNFAEVAQLYTDDNGERTAELYGYWNGKTKTTSEEIYHSLSDNNIIPELTDVYRMKVVVEDSMADLYVASYTGDTLDTWQYLFSINDIAKEHGSGSVGFLATGLRFRKSLKIIPY